MVGHSAFWAFEPALVVRKAGGRTNLFVLFPTGFRTVRNPFPVFVFEIISDLVQLHPGSGNKLGVGVHEEDRNCNDKTCGLNKPQDWRLHVDRAPKE